MPSLRPEQVIRILKTHRRELHRLGVRDLSLFGSVVRNEATEASDVDFLVEFDRPVGLFGLIGVKQFLEGILDCTVDLGTADTLREPLRKEILREAIRVA